MTFTAVTTLRWRFLPAWCDELTDRFFVFSSYPYDYDLFYEPFMKRWYCMMGTKRCLPARCDEFTAVVHMHCSSTPHSFVNEGMRFPTHRRRLLPARCDELASLPVYTRFIHGFMYPTYRRGFYPLDAMSWLPFRYLHLFLRKKGGERGFYPLDATSWPSLSTSLLLKEGTKDVHPLEARDHFPISFPFLWYDGYGLYDFPFVFFYEKRFEGRYTPSLR